MSQLLDLIELHEGFRKDAYWDKTGQEMWQGINPNVIALSSTPMDWKQKLGHLTIGYGTKLADWSKAMAHDMVISKLRHETLPAAVRYPWFFNLGDPVDDPDFSSADEIEAWCAYATPRQAVIVSMIYQLGPTGFAGFKRMIVELESAVKWSDYDQTEYRQMDFGDAAEEMLDSKWQRQLKDRQTDKTKPTRADELAKMMRSGEWPT